MNNHPISHPSARSFTVAAAALLALALVGCNNRDGDLSAKGKADSGATQTAATAVEDTAITTRVTASLAADAGLKALDIRVETNAGRTTLRGTAPDAAAQSRAQQLAAAVPGVSSVDNQLTIAR